MLESRGNANTSIGFEGSMPAGSAKSIVTVVSPGPTTGGFAVDRPNVTTPMPGSVGSTTKVVGVENGPGFCDTSRERSCHEKMLSVDSGVQAGVGTCAT